MRAAALAVPMICACFAAVEGDPAPQVPEPPALAWAETVVPPVVPPAGAPHPGSPEGALRVAIEGRCPLNLDVLGTDVFAYDQQTGRIVRLSGGRPGRLPVPRPGGHDRDGAPAAPFNHLWGRWPDALFADIVTEEGSVHGTGLLHWDRGRWQPVPGLVGGHPIRAVEPWHEGSALALVHTIHTADVRRQLRRVGDEAEAPSLTRLHHICGEDYHLEHVVVDRRGTLGVKWGCRGVDFFALWPPGATHPITRRLDIPYEPGPFSVDPDERGGFFLSYRSGLIHHVDAQGDRTVQAPRGLEALQHVGVGPDGRLFAVSSDRVYRQTDDGWKREHVPGQGFIHDFSGAETDGPWLRRGGTFFNHFLHFRSSGRIHARDPDSGAWRAVPPIASSIDPRQRLYVDFIHTDDHGHRWMLAHAGRPAKHDRPRHWAVVTTAPFGAPVGCP